MCQKTVTGVVLKRHGPLESVVHRKVHATFGGEGLVFLSHQDPASYPTPDAVGALQSLWLLGGGGDSIRSSTAWLCLPSQIL